MFIKLKQTGCSDPIRINTDHIEYYGLEEEGKVTIVVTSGQNVLTVQETTETIDRMLQESYISIKESK